MAKEDQSGDGEVLHIIKINRFRRIVVVEQTYKGKLQFCIRYQKREDEDEDWHFVTNGINIEVEKVSGEQLADLARAIMTYSKTRSSSKKKRADEDDEDEPPKKKKRRTEEDDED